MASAPALSSSKEKTNYARLCRLLVDGGTQALRNIFDSIYPPANLHTALQKPSVRSTLDRLKTRKIIKPTQWGHLYPAIPSAVTSATFDISLLCILLRNICELPQPKLGWDEMPAECDVATEDDVVRLRLYRNKLLHGRNTSITEADFKQYWNKISEAEVRLGGDDFKDAIKKLECETMDPESEEHYTRLLKEWSVYESSVNENLIGINENLELMVSLLVSLVEEMALGNERTHNEDAEHQQPTSEGNALALGSSSSVESNFFQEALEIFLNDQATGATGFSDQTIESQDNIRFLQWLHTAPVETIVNKMLQCLNINLQSSLQPYDENTRKVIRHFSQFFKSRRKELFDSIRGKVRSGSTGPYLDERTLISDLPYEVMKELRESILYHDVWKRLASQVGVKNQTIGVMEKNGDPANETLKKWELRGHTVKDLYDFLVKIECEKIADIL